MRLEKLLIRQKDNSAIAIKHGDKSIKYNEWYLQSSYVAQKLISKIKSESINIAVFLPNSINYAVSYFAVQIIKRILIPIGIQAKEPEIISTLNYCEVDLLITDSHHAEEIKKVLISNKYSVTMYIIDLDEFVTDCTTKEFIPKTNCVEQKGSDEDVAIMLHTSGTTNNPKRVMLTHRNLITNVESNIKSLKLNQNDKVLIALPMFFGYCNTAQFLTHLYLGATIVILDSIFLPKQFFQIVERENITNFTGVPSMLLMFLNYRYSNKYNFDSLRYICFGGGKMPVDKLKQLIEQYPSVGFVQTYGQTECSPRVTALLPQYSIIKIGSVGTPIPNVQIRIINETGVPLPKNQIGEIVVYGNNVMKGYYKQDEITAQTIRDGWVYTGDLGYIDGDGFLYLTGRIKNIIISGGINIYPEEIEQLLIENECVEDACVIGEEHPLLGEVPIARIILKSPIEFDDLLKYCTSRLTDYKVPARIEIVTELPKTYNGKIKRF